MLIYNLVTSLSIHTFYFLTFCQAIKGKDEYYMRVKSMYYNTQAFLFNRRRSYTKMEDFNEKLSLTSITLILETLKLIC